MEYPFTSETVQYFQIKHFLKLKNERKEVKFLPLDLNSGFEIRPENSHTGKLSLVFRLETGEWLSLLFESYDSALKVFSSFENAVVSGESQTIVVEGSFNLLKARNLWESL